MRPTSLRSAGDAWFKGEYFANRELTGKPAAELWSRPLNFDFGVADPARPSLPRGAPDKDVSVRWTGDLTTTLAGDYEFLVRGRGGFRLKLGGEIIVDAWAVPPGEEKLERKVHVTRHLPDNAVLPLQLEYVQGDGPLKVAVDWNTPPADSGEADALATAKAADLIVFVGGISAQLEGEEMAVDYEGFAGGDRLGIELPALQQQLLEKLKALGKPIIYVNLSGSAIAMSWADKNLNAIIQAWYPGQAGGTAVADVLLGNYNPAGRLPLTFYAATSDLPDFKDYAMTGRTYRYFKGKPVYPFGHGLSYTQFSYTKLGVTTAAVGGLTVSVEVKNSGQRDGDEVVQLYLTPPAASHPRELRALCGFRRVHLKAGETQAVTIAVPATALRRWSEDKKDYTVPSGDWFLGAGASSADIRQKTVIKL
jgi:beta-glucosidase